MNYIKPFIAILVIGIIIVTSCSEGGSITTNTKLKNNTDTISYILGNMTGANFKEIDFSPNLKAFAQGIQDAKNDTSKFQNQEMGQILQKFQLEIEQNRMIKEQEIAQKNKEKEEVFLAENKEKEGITTTESGLQYKIITEGTGNKPKETDKVKCNYTGKLLDGTIFDSSTSPIEFPVNGVIQGWQEALQLMPTGSKWELFIPASLAYGARGAGDRIEPNSTLHFEIELLEIVK